MSASIWRLSQRAAGNPVFKFHFTASRPAFALQSTNLRSVAYILRTKSTDTKVAGTTQNAGKKRASSASSATAVKKKPVARAATKTQSASRKTSASRTKSASAKKTTTAKKSAKKPIKKAATRIVKKKAKKAKAPAKKAAPKKKKKVLTDEEKYHEKVKAAKRFALRPPAFRPSTGYNMFCKLTLKNSGDTTGFTPITSEAARVWNALPVAEKTKYYEMAKEHNDKKAVIYNNFINQYTVEEIEKANRARRWLKAQKTPRFTTTILKDPRKVKGAPTAYMQFIIERYNTLEGASVIEKAKAASQAWNALSDGEKKPYFDMYQTAKERVKSEQVLRA